MKIIHSLILGTALSLGGMAAFAGDASGTFKGLKGYGTKGGVTITQNADGTHTVTLASNFSMKQAPDPQIGFGNNGRFTKGTNISLLKSNKGSQSFIVPANIDVSNFTEVYVYCVQYSVPLGVAKLN